MKQECVFCQIKKEKVFYESRLFVGIWDSYPVTLHHALIIPKRHVPDAEGLTLFEWAGLRRAFHRVKRLIIKQDPNVSGFNLGFNVGEVAGQTVMHAHFHIIPRQAGDHPTPRGGIRAVIPGKQSY